MSLDERQLYEDVILRHVDEPYHRGLLADATHRHRIDNPVCGDSVQIELRIADAGVVEAVWFTGTGCVISQAAASMLVEHIEGRPLAVLRCFTSHDMLNLFRARLTPLRQQCCLLAWRALRSTLESPITSDSAKQA